MLVGGFKGFLVVWLGQLASLFGSALTRFALTIWIFEQVGQATPLALLGVFGTAPMIILMPLGGAISDRFSRKQIMIGSDIAAGVATSGLLVLYSTGQLEIWHMYAANVISSAAEAFQYPAFMASIQTIVPQEHYARANGMHGLARSASSVFAPVVAGALLAVLDIGQIMTIDLVTFALAVLAVAFVRIPQPKQRLSGSKQPGIFADIAEGFRFILDRRPFAWLQTVLLSFNFVATLSVTLTAPLVLMRTGNDEIVLAIVQGTMSAGALAGGLVISAWGGPKRRILAVLAAPLLTGVFGHVMFGLGRSLLTWLPGAFFLFFFIPINNGATGAIWMSKTPAEVQGRVAALRRFAAQITVPLGIAIAGPLADQLFEPAMAGGGWLPETFGWMVGSGPGAGLSMIVVFAGIILTLISLAIRFTPVIWRIEDLLPDQIPVSAPDRLPLKAEPSMKQAPAR